MRQLTLLSLFALLIVRGPIDAEEWVPVASSNQAVHYLDKDSIVHQPDTVKTWVKTIYSDPQQGIKERRHLEEYRLGSRQSRLLMLANFDSEGTLLKSTTYPDAGWRAFSPGSVAGQIWDYLVDPSRVAAARHEDWVKLLVREGNTWYLDRNSITRRGHTAETWVQVDFGAAIDQDGTRTMTVQKAFRDDRTVRTLVLVRYDGSGNKLDKVYVAEDWTPVVPGAPDETVWSYVFGR